MFATNRNELEPGVLTVVSAYGELLATTDQPLIFFEHGAGFQYEVKHGSYAGAADRERVVLFCNPNEYVDNANRIAHPNIKSAIVGCPKLDTLSQLPTPIGKTKVAFSWHWDCRVTAETRSAWRHYRGDLKQIAERNAGRWKPLGHAHPRAWSTVRFDYARWGWQQARFFDQVCKEASVYVCDSSSTIYEFAALGRPVVVLNAPWYRRNVHHGLRFWENVPGIQVDHPNELEGAIHECLTNDTWEPERRRITDLIYPHLGNSANTAAKAILELF